jgi:hypothetical protein
LAVKRQLARKRSNGSMARPSGPSVRPRRRRIFRTRRRLGWGWIRHLPLLWLGALAVCAFLFYFVVGSGIFSVKKVVAVGLKPPELAQVVDRCRCIGQNIFVVRPDDIQKRLESIPTLIIKRVYTSMPNNVYVEAAYRPRVAIWRTPEAAYAVAADGEVLQVWRKPFPHFHPFPVFDEGYDDTIKKGRRLIIGEHVPADALAMALSLHSRVPPALQSQVKEYYYRPFIGLTLIGTTNWWALFGLDYSAKLDQRVNTVIAALAHVPPIPGPGGCVDLRAVLYYRHDHTCG